jgi:hypothetical protein
MHGVLFLLGFLVGAGGAAIFLAGLVSAAVSTLAWLRLSIASQRDQALAARSPRLASPNVRSSSRVT